MRLGWFCYKIVHHNMPSTSNLSHTRWLLLLDLDSFRSALDILDSHVGRVIFSVVTTAPFVPLRVNWSLITRRQTVKRMTRISSSTATTCVACFVASVNSCRCLPKWWQCLTLFHAYTRLAGSLYYNQ